MCRQQAYHPCREGGQREVQGPDGAGGSRPSPSPGAGRHPNGLGVGSRTSHHQRLLPPQLGQPHDSLQASGALFFLFFFLMWTIFFKVFIEFVTILFLFYELVFGWEAYGILAPPPGIDTTPPALEGSL